MKAAILCAILCGVVFATVHTTITKEYELEGEEFDGGDSLWLPMCTQAIQDSGKCTGCTCTEVHWDDPIKLTVTGDELSHDKLDDHIEGDGIAIHGETYVYPEEDEDGTMTMVVTMGIFALMAFCIIAFFACNEWPNTPEKIAAREKARAEAEKERIKEEEAKKLKDELISARGW